MEKISCLTLFVLFATAASNLKCYTYICDSHNGLSCTPSLNHKQSTCGNAVKGYQSVCSYVAIDDIKDGDYKVEAACAIVPNGNLQHTELSRCVDKDVQGKVVYCNICNTDLCNTPPKK